MRLLLLLALAVSAVGCDSESSVETPAFLGSWDIASVALDTYVTVSRAQSVRDPFGRGDGGITVTGAATGIFPYFFGSTADGGRNGVVLDVFPRARTSIVVRSIRFVGDNPIRVEFSVLGGEPAEVYVQRASGGPPAYTLTDTALEIAPVLLESPTGNVMASGRLIFPRANLPANRETALTPFVFGPDNNFVRRITFEPSGVLTQVEVDGRSASGLQTRTGTWALRGDGRVAIAFEDVGESVYQYTVAGSALTLSLDVAPCVEGCNTDLEGQVEFGAQPGTTLAIRRTERTIFRPAARDVP